MLGSTDRQLKGLNIWNAKAMVCKVAAAPKSAFVTCVRKLVVEPAAATRPTGAPRVIPQPIAYVTPMPERSPQSGK